mgnify:CR=1 FL=1
MATILNKLPEYARPGRKEEYPYDDWFDGQVWELTEGEDYKSDTRYFKTRIRAAATRRGIKVTVAHTFDSDGKGRIVVKAKPYDRDRAISGSGWIPSE